MVVASLKNYCTGVPCTSDTVIGPGGDVEHNPPGCNPAISSDSPD
jgi:hypothetical protein